MRKQWSVEQIMASLEAEAEEHRRQAEHHAGHEAFHREKRTHHEQEHEALTRRLDAFRAASADALEAVQKRLPPAGPADEGMDIGPASRPRLTRIIKAILDELAPGQSFGPGWLAEEANRRHGARLRHLITPRQISDVLRRMTRQGRLEQIRQGKGRYESRFVRVG